MRGVARARWVGASERRTGVAEDPGALVNRHGSSRRQLMIGSGRYFSVMLSRTSEGYAKMSGKFLLSENFHCYKWSEAKKPAHRIYIGLIESIKI